MKTKNRKPWHGRVILITKREMKNLSPKARAVVKQNSAELARWLILEINTALFADLKKSTQAKKKKS
jgi:hypothetical protein